MPLAAFLLCLCCIHSYGQPSVDTNKQNETNEMDILMTSLMEDFVSELNKAGIDYINLTNEYKKLCPSQLNRCRNCSCDAECWKRQHCCPDCPHAFLKRGCVNIAVKGSPIDVMMIDECPHSFEGGVEIEEFCSLRTSEIAPVSYMEFDFKNKYCAQCHGVNVYESWEVVVTCDKPMPDDLLIDNTLEETLSSYGCKVELRHPNLTNRRVLCDKVSRSSQLGRCNVTGLWKVYDKGLAWACETLNSLPRFGVFKNVYCYLCNPSLASRTDRPQVKSCISNQTCSSEPGFSERLSPYGSVCIMECNDIGKVVKLYATVDDNITVTINEKVDHETGQSKVQIQLLMSNTDQVLTTVKPFLFSIYGDNFHDWTVNRNLGEIPQIIVNETILQEQIKTYYAICGEQIMCDRSMLSYTTAYYGGTGSPIFLGIGDLYRFGCVIYGNQDYCLDSSTIIHYECTFKNKIKTPQFVTTSRNEACGSCSCSPNCLHYDTCCVDLLLKQQPFSCYSEADFPSFYPSDSNLPKDKVQADNDKINSYSLVSDCLGESPLYFSMCTGIDNNTDLLSHIPVTAGKIIYKSIYCMLCNQGRLNVNTVINFELQCNSYLEAALFPDLQSTLSVARTKCKTQFKPKRVRPCKKKTYRSTIVPKFYATGHHSSFLTSDVKIIDKCNETGMWADNSFPIRQLCEDDSATSMYLPEYRIDLKVYKNFACFECNPEVSLTREDDGGTITDCGGNKTGDKNTMLQLCLYHPTHTRWFPYKNFFCAQCNQPPLKLFDLSLQGNCIFVKEEPIYTYRNLLRLGPGKRNSDSAGESTCVGIYNTEKKICRVLQCAKERDLVNNFCVKKIEILLYIQGSVSSSPDVTYQLRFKLTPDVRNTVDDKDTVSLEMLCTDLMNTLWENVNLFFYSCQVYNVSCETTNVTVENLQDLVFSYIVDNISEEIDEPIKDVVPTLVDSLSGLYTIESDSGQILLLRASPVIKEYDFPSNISTCTFYDMYEEYSRLNVTVYVDKFLNCPHVRFDASEVQVDAENGRLTLHHDGSTFKIGDYQLSNGSFIICKQDYNSSKRRETTSDNTSTFMKAYTVFNRMCILLSLVCLSFTFVTFSVFKTLRSTPCKNIMTLTLTLFIAQLLMLISPFIRTSVQSCAVLGISIHYFWLAMFCAMCVCSYHMFKLFYIGCLSQPNQGRISSNIVAKYNAFVFGLPLLIITLVIICHLLTTNGLFSGYTRNNFEMCFLSGFYPMLFGFIIPVVLLNLAGIIFFSMSFHKIRTSPRMCSKENRRDVIIFIKLCTLVGITWPLQIVDAAFDLSVLSFIVVCFNAFQGVFIFASYICNARVLRLYKALIDRKPPPLTSSDKFSSRPTAISTDTV